MTVKNEKPREYLFDNYKALLILFVVISHFIDHSYKHNPFLYEFKWMIVSFHMPAFLFISGYFSKKTASFLKLLRTLVIPYFVFQILYHILYSYILHKNSGLWFTKPKFTLWYLMALFFYKLLTPVFKRIPAFITLPLSIGGGLLIGLTELDNFLTIPRALFFLPFFLAGLYFDPEWVSVIRNKYTARASAIALLGTFVFLFFEKQHRELPVYIFYGRYSYSFLKQTAEQGICIRAACYGIAFLMLFLWLMVMPNRKCSFSYIGMRTMPVYLFHGLIYRYLVLRTKLLGSVRSWLQVILLLLFCVFLTWQLSQPAFVRAVNILSGSELPHFLRKKES